MAKVVMIHGMSCTPHVWENFRPRFEAAGHEVIAPALRHHDVDPAAAPPAELGATSLADYRDDLETLIAGLGETPVLVGHSMGGLLVQMLAARNTPAAAVLLTPAWPRGIHNFDLGTMKLAVPHMLRAGAFWKKPFKLTEDEAARSLFTHLDPAEQKRQYARLVSESGRAILLELAQWYLDPNRTTAVDAAAITCPLLIVNGAGDGIVPIAVGRKIARRYPQADYRELAEHGHWVMGETGWEKIADDVLAWLDANLPRAA